MRQNKNFSLFIISDVPYLLPFGQGMADQKRGVQLNATGAYLWKLLEKERTEEELLSLCAEHYRIPASQMPRLKADLQQFIRIMDSYGILNRSGDSAVPDSEAANVPCPDIRTEIQTAAEITAGEEAYGDNSAGAVCADTVQRYLSIGGLTLLFRGADKAFSRNFDAFEIFPGSGSVPSGTAESSPACSSRNAAAAEHAIPVDQTVTVIDHAPVQRPQGNILLQNRELTVMENDLQYILLFPDAPGIHEAHLTKDGAEARYYCCPPYTGRLRQDLFHAIRLSFLYLAQLHDMAVLHSASLLYRDRAWLFSGHSGAGKSTHTGLWKELYDVPLINGDLNLLSVRNGCPMVHGLPWCGTSGISDTRSFPLGGILLVKKSQENRVVSLDDSHAQLLVAQRLISPCWTEALMRKNLRFVADLAPHILICRLHCTKTPDAAETARKAIDDYLAQQTAGLPTPHTAC